jgi:hypothetical protein
LRWFVWLCNLCRNFPTALVGTKNPRAVSDSPFGFGAVTWGHEVSKSVHPY